MPLPLKSASELVNDQVNAVQASSVVPLDFNIGSILRAVIESNSGNSLWIEALITDLLSKTRLSTCVGEDVDTFVGDFGLQRKAAFAAFGLVTFSRFTYNSQAIIKVGATVYCVTNTTSYSVTIDESNPYYVPSLTAYVIPANTQSISVPVTAITAGSVGNCLANQITTISSVIIGVDSVTNSQPFTNGQDQQSDQSLKNEFPIYLASLFRATRQAIEFAIQIVPGVSRFKLVENKTITGQTQLGFFYAVIDDGSGNASLQLINNVLISVEQYRGLTIAYAVYAPTPFPISVTASVIIDNSVPSLKVISNIQAAIQKCITSKSFDSIFPYSKVPAIIYDSDSSIIDVTSYTLNGGNSDVLITGRQIMTVGTISITVV
jgi:uncharacterized phage protein gp47/JayE